MTPQNTKKRFTGTGDVSIQQPPSLQAAYCRNFEAYAVIGAWIVDCDEVHSPGWLP